MSQNLPRPEGPDTRGSTPVPADEVASARQVNGDRTETVPPEAGPSLPVVGLGGSAGGLEALLRFFKATPADTGTVYVVVLHLAPERESALAPILQRETRMPVSQVTEAVKVKPDHVYVIPPGKHLSMTDGWLDVIPMEASKGKRVAVDLFFRTLADSHGPSATAIVLSGGDGDGAAGLKRIKERGGLTIAQDPVQADQDGMPRAAIATGMVDWILPVEDIPERLQSYRAAAKRLQLPPEETPGEKEERTQSQAEEDALYAVLAFLRQRSGHDFSYYKRATILRRIARRMQVTSRDTLSEYLDYLRRQPGETRALLQDLLISVTNFFRDREVFAAFEDKIPQLFKGKSPADQVRVWVAGCATGEEAYSIAMLLSEHASRMDAPPQIQIFASDIDETAIEVAREGSYPETIVADVSEERLRRFFTHEGGRYRVRRAVRETVIFALHDLLKDSPFSKLDMIACRNLLIYLNRDAQSRVFDIFHFALREGGVLLLGSSESAEEASALFDPIEKKQRIYRRRNVPRPVIGSYPGLLRLPPLHPPGESAAAGVKITEGPNGGPPPAAVGAVLSNRTSGSWSDLHLRLLAGIVPPSLIVNRSHDIVHLSEGVARFLQLSGGEPSMNVLRVVHPDLRARLRAALFRAFKTAEVVELERTRIDSGDNRQLVDVTVHPGPGSTPDYALVLFETRSDDSPEAAPPKRIEPEGVVRHLEEELDLIRGQWRETVEQYEASTEELKASNEELQAMNEELRAATEELETGREELQSINEEVTTVNQELKSKVELLSRANSDLQNLMASTNIATVFLDRELRIKRYTPPTVELFNLIPTDIGRPMSDLTHRLDYPEIAADAQRVLERLVPVEREVRTSDGRWFLARFLPYRTMEDKIAGVVLTCVEITQQKRSDETTRWLSAVVESSNDAIISFTLDGNIISWNRGAQRMFGYTSGEMIGRPQAILAPPEYLEEKKQILESLRRGEEITSLETVRQRKDGSRIDVSLSASVMRSEEGEILGATAIAQDITARKQAVEDLRQARDELELRVDQRTAELRERADQLRALTLELTKSEQRERARMASLLHDHIQQLLVSAKMRVESLRRKGQGDQDEELGILLSLLEESLERSRTLTGDLSPPALTEGLAAALEWLGETWMKDKHGLTVHLDLDREVDADGDEMRTMVFLTVRELLFNVVKHADVDEASVRLAAEENGSLCVTVSDGGRGFDPAELSSPCANGSGIGLAAIRERIATMGGRLELISSHGRGVEVRIHVPRRKISRKR